MSENKEKPRVDQDVLREAARRVDELRNRFIPLTARLTPDIEPALVFTCLPPPEPEA